MPVVAYVFAGLVALNGAIATYGWVWPRLFGAWYCTGWFGQMPFWTREQAERFRRDSADPYARGVEDGPIVFRPGWFFRRSG